MHKPVSKMTFEEWFQNRTHMTVEQYVYMASAGEKHLCYRYHKDYFKPLPEESYYEEHARKYVEHCKKMYEEERQKEACLNYELTFVDWLFIYHHGHTPESFYKNCTDTGMTYKEYSSALRSLQKKFEEHQNNINPFLGGN